MKRTIFVLSVAVLFVAAISFVTANGSQEKSAGAQAGAPQTVTLNLWRAGSDAIESSYWESAIQIYEKANPNVKINLTSIPWGNALEAKLNTAYVGGTFPDLVSYSIASIAPHAAAGQYAPLDEFVKSWPGKSDLIPKILSLGNFNGHIYGIGFIPDPRVLVWRKDYFQAAGLDPNTPPSSWESLATDALKLTQKTHGATTRAGFYIDDRVDNGNAAQTWQVFAVQNDSPIMDVSKNEALFDNPKGVEAAAYLTNLYRQGVSIHVSATVDAFSNGQAAISYDNPSAVQTLINQNPDLKGQVGYAPPLKRVQQSTFAGLRLMFIGSQSKYKEADWKFIEFLLSKDETWRRYQTLKSPIVLQSLKDQFIQADPSVNAAVYQAILVGQGYPVVSYSFNFMELISQALQQAYYGVKSPQRAFDDANAEFTKQLPAWLGK